MRKLEILQKIRLLRVALVERLARLVGVRSAKKYWYIEVVLANSYDYVVLSIAVDDHTNQSNQK